MNKSDSVGSIASGASGDRRRVSSGPLLFTPVSAPEAPGNMTRVGSAGSVSSVGRIGHVKGLGNPGHVAPVAAVPIPRHPLMSALFPGTSSTSKASSPTKSPAASSVSSAHAILAADSLSVNQSPGGGMDGAAARHSAVPLLMSPIGRQAGSVQSDDLGAAGRSRGTPNGVIGPAPVSSSGNEGGTPGTEGRTPLEGRSRLSNMVPRSIYPGPIREVSREEVSP